MKYNAYLAEAQRILPSARHVLIALPAQASVDHLASGLSLFLALGQIKKDVSVVCDGPILVGHTNLFGIGEVKNKVPQSSGGNFVLTLGGVANPQDLKRPIPAVEKMDYKSEGSDLKLIFNVYPGQRFEPTFITPSYQGSNFEVVFVIGAANLNLLGNLYTTNPQVFAGVHLVNIDNSQVNSQFGLTNVVDSAAACLSEMIAQILPGLALPMDADIATNILSGIYFATNNLQGGNLTPDTFLMIAESLRVGGQRPTVSGLAAPVIQPVPVQTISPTQLMQTPPPWMGTASQEEQNRAFVQAFTPTINQGPEKPSEPVQPVSSPEERPSGEGVTAEGEVIHPEPDWLTPKIFKGTGLG